MSRKAGIFAALVILCALAGGGWYLFHKKSGGEEGGRNKGPQPVVTQAARTRDLTTAINAVGSLVAGEAADIHAEIAGQIENVPFGEGQPVKKGDVLIQMDTSLLETELMRAKAAQGVAEANFNRDDRLKKSGFVADQQWDASRAALQEAEAAVANAEIRIRKSSIRAPFDGIAGLRNFSPGDFAAQGQTLTALVSIDPLKLEFTVPERNYATVRAGQDIGFAVDAFPGERFGGKIYAVDPRINVENRNFTVKADIPNGDGRLRPGMYARIRIDTATRENVLMAPEEAIVPEGEDSYVFVVKDGKAFRRKVTLGERLRGAVEISEGLKAGEKIIVAGTMKLKDGAAVAEQAAAQEPDETETGAGAGP